MKKRIAWNKKPEGYYGYCSVCGKALKRWQKQYCSIKCSSRRMVGNQYAKGNKPNRTSFKRGDNVGSKHWRWKGGDPYYRGYGWEGIAEQVLARDNRQCRLCDKKAVGVHHIISYRISLDNSESNLISLCSECHTREDQAFEANIREYLRRWKQDWMITRNITIELAPVAGSPSDPKQAKLFAETQT